MPSSIIHDDDRPSCAFVRYRIHVRCNFKGSSLNIRSEKKNTSATAVTKLWKAGGGAVPFRTPDSSDRVLLRGHATKTTSITSQFVLTTKFHDFFKKKSEQKIICHSHATRGGFHSFGFGFLQIIGFHRRQLNTFFSGLGFGLSTGFWKRYFYLR